MSPEKSVLSMVGFTLVAGLLAAIALTPVAGLVGFAAARADDTMKSSLDDMADGRAPGVTTITDAQGTPMAWVYDQRRYEVAPDEISQAMKDAIVSIEDRRFYEHDGVDLQGTLRAMAANLVSGSVAQGASTIDQQYVKNYLLLVGADTDEERSEATETSIPRKLREMRTASDLRKVLSPDEVLARYLNIVHFGNGAFGVEAAARTYFDIPAAELNVAQSAMLAGIVQSSSYLDPYTNPEAVTERRNTVLQSMVEYGAIPQEEADALAAEPLGVLESPNTIPNGCIGAGDRGFMCDYALTYLEEKGISLDQLKHDAYTVKTTLDPASQDAARDAMANNIGPQQPGVAGVVNVVAPGENSRDILAMASSRTYGLDTDAAQTVLPQPTSLIGNGAGSVFKIFTAAAAIDQGMGIDTRLEVPRRFEAQGMGHGGAAGCPANSYCVENDSTYPASMTMREALAQSPNTTFVKLIQEVGVTPVVDLAVALGLRSYAAEGSFDGDSSIADYMKENNLGSFTLGPTQVNPLELSNVGATLASGGRWCEPNPIVSVTDRDGNDVHIDRPECEQAVSPGVAGALMEALSDDTVNGTASAAAKAAGWSRPMSSKTGTTESYQSAAYLGFNTGFSAAPYIYNDGTSTSQLCTAPVRQCGAGNLYGGKEPAASWFQIAHRSDAARSGGLPGMDRRFAAGEAEGQLAQVAGMGESEARSRLQDSRFRVINTEYADGNEVPLGRVVRAYSNGGRDVTLVLSNGRRTQAPTERAPLTEPARPNRGDLFPEINRDDLDDLTERLREGLGDLADF